VSKLYLMVMLGVPPQRAWEVDVAIARHPTEPVGRIAVPLPPGPTPGAAQPAADHNSSGEPPSASGGSAGAGTSGGSPGGGAAPAARQRPPRSHATPGASSSASDEEGEGGGGDGEGGGADDGAPKPARTSFLVLASNPDVDWGALGAQRGGALAWVIGPLEGLRACKLSRD
jgi:hypothetical protein